MDVAFVYFRKAKINNGSRGECQLPTTCAGATPPTQRDFIPSLINIIAHVSVFSQDTSFEPQIPQKNSSNDVKCVIKYRWFFLVLRLLLLCVYVLKRHCVGHSNMPAWCFLAFSEVEMGWGHGHPPPPAAEHRQGQALHGAACVAPAVEFFQKATAPS